MSLQVLWMRYSKIKNVTCVTQSRTATNRFTITYPETQFSVWSRQHCHALKFQSKSLKVVCVDKLYKYYHHAKSCTVIDAKSYSVQCQGLCHGRLTGSTIGWHTSWTHISNIYISMSQKWFINRQQISQRFHNLKLQTYYYESTLTPTIYI